MLTGEPAGKRRLGTPRHRWRVDDIRIDLKEICVNTRKSIDSTQDKDNPCECATEPVGFISHDVNNNNDKDKKVIKRRKIARNKNYV